ncbi:TetR family transcriptional regulator [Robbsia andropogonis]|uniref:TetR family transcriptional regulator n=1 Tax=Robbsia andropogonis TaxID=28092 RepID=A0A0F5JUY7_9BURK|nr:TetR/AcrR family transcriptional regulator [Robbsia andropogonis]KKB61663.1 TetR family transcriptional regulator [Robbsia andropogonis]MCP1120815.1 TetR/AcrR family transcriptional regulator [Robbsia andropogonis]MCP1130608.1 TetR/AcrR family transcriptional regulator [Robbsia andropogonis]
MNTSATHETSDVRRKILETGRRIMAGKGYSGVGLNEILTASGVPKGSFYHWFASKDAFGEALLDHYFTDYLAEVDELLSAADQTMAQRLIRYWTQWEENQSVLECQGKCLAVKLGAEVADFSDAMRAALDRGTSRIVRRIADTIEAGVAEGSLSVQADARVIAESLYEMWLGASVMAKIVRNKKPFRNAMIATQLLLGLAGK